MEAPLDALFPLLFGAIASHLAGLNPRRRGHLLGTLALQGVAASSLGLSISALAPSTEAALALGPCIMVLSIMLADSGGVFAEVPKSLEPLAKLSIVKWGFEGAMGAEFPGLKFNTDDVDAGLPVGGRAPAAARAAAAALCIKDGEQVLTRMGLPAHGGVGRAATAQVRATAISLGVTLAALSLRGAGGRPQAWEAGLRRDGDE